MNCTDFSHSAQTEKARAKKVEPIKKTVIFIVCRACNSKKDVSFRFGNETSLFYLSYYRFSLFDKVFQFAETILTSKSKVPIVQLNR